MKQSIELFTCASIMMIAALSCSDSPTGGEDAGAPDTYDAGTFALCPVEANPACTQASDCGMDDKTNFSGCAGCERQNFGLCEVARCTTPERLEIPDTHTILLSIQPGVQVRSVASHVLTLTTAGGNRITCDDVRAGRVDLTNTCFNVIDSRGRELNQAGGSIYRIDFSGFPRVDQALFVIYGYTTTDSQGEPVALSCTQADIVVGEGAQTVDGDMLRRLE